MPLMVYSPVDHGRLLDRPALGEMAGGKRVPQAQLAIAWVLRLPGVYAGVKASTPERVREDRAAMEVSLGRQEPGQLDRVFPPPSGKVLLEML
jgi:diketogulonate reductase-like aldo/keto reductase